jgi:hypothetical protein
MPSLEKEGIRYTIHDSFCLKNQESVRIKEIFNSKLAELYGIAPSLHLNYIVESDRIK